MRLPSLILVGASLLATVPAIAQLNDGKPDSELAVPPRLDLPYALAFALDNNFAIRQAKERIKEQEGVVLEVRGALLPNVSAGGGYLRSSEEVAPSGDDYYWSYNIIARQNLFTGGAVTGSIKSQKLTLDAAVLALQAVINDSLLEVRTRFYTVLLNREKIKVQEQNVELLQRQLQDVKNRFEAGTVSNFEVLRAEVALANAQPALITARNDFRLSIETLRKALGYVTVTESDASKPADTEFIGSLDYVPTGFNLWTAITTAREQRPDLQRLKRLTAAAEEGVIVRRAGYYPSLALYGGYDWRKTAGSSTFPGDRQGWTVGVTADWSIFDGRATAGRVAQARSFLEQSKLAYADAQLTVDVEVRRAISTFQQATELAEASKKVVQQAEEAVRLANARYSAGTATQLDVLTSQVDFTTAQLNQIEAYYTYNIAVATTRRAMGLSDELRPAGEFNYPVN